jgi:hypothetical protein
MKIDCTRLPVRELPEDGPSLVIVAKNAGETLTARYIQGVDIREPLPSEEPLVVIFRSTPLSTPDIIQVIETSRNECIFLISIETRRYEGELAANVETIALIQVKLGCLGPGDYEVAVNETTLYFFELKHPENATKLTTALHRLRFEVR